MRHYIHHPDPFNPNPGLLELLLDAQVVSVSALLLTAVLGTGGQASVAPITLGPNTQGYWGRGILIMGRDAVVLRYTLTRVEWSRGVGQGWDSLSADHLLAIEGLGQSGQGQVIHSAAESQHLQRWRRSSREPPSPSVHVQAASQPTRRGRDTGSQLHTPPSPLPSPTWDDGHTY